MTAPKLPEFVYLIAVEGEWPVSAVAGDHMSTPGIIADEVRRRTTGVSTQARSRAHVWRVPVRDAVEMELVPEERIPAGRHAKE